MNKLTPALTDLLDTARCPLCSRPNDCQLCSTTAYKGPCWCMKVTIPETLLAQVPSDSLYKACICQDCVMEFHRTRMSAAPPPKILPGDFYFDGGLMVFTAEYHSRRGYCCGSGCRHCPYQKAGPKASIAA